MNQTTLIEHLLSLTHAIEDAAALADWPEAARLTEERSPLLVSLSADQDPAALEMIRLIQAIDATVLANAQTTQVELQAEYRAAMIRAKATGQYQQVAQF
ncbi:flagellar protein FliT [Paraburkholderia kirstenboschensis]|uniref:Flagellar protein FliT n=1 Tax=Paraburkholderia kirstenboschensis TaxID=1245436 RepID=A0ABZ0EMR2_9BURK|nr:flagellar protein FliT [Paraburkholderia kirstenboschensis]WOD17915.1 flagellar protein FliT [Paraburkholderia kirstenboschensis]